MSVCLSLLPVPAGGGCLRRGTFPSPEKYPTRPKSRRFAAVGLVSARLRAGEKGASPLRAGPPPFCPIGHHQIGRCAATEATKSFGDPICGGFLNDASVVGPVKGIRESSGSVPDCLRLWELLRLPSTKICKIFRPEGPRRKKIRTPFQPEGRQAKYSRAPHRSRDGRRPKGDSAATRPQITPRPIRQKRGSSPKGAGAFSAHFWASKSGPAGGKTWDSGCGPPQKKKETPLSPRGDSRSAAEHRTGHEVAGGPKEIQRHLGISSDTD